MIWQVLEIVKAAGGAARGISATGLPAVALAKVGPAAVVNTYGKMT